MLIANPTATPADVAVTYLLSGGGTIDRTYRVAGQTRFTIWVDQEDPRLADAAVSTLVRSTNNVPLAVERAMWWPGPTATTWHEAHNSAGATRAAKRWAVADGENGGDFGAETYILLANTETRAGQARVTFFFADGGAVARTFTLPASSRMTVAAGFDMPESKGRRFATLVESVGPSPVDLVIERSMYSNAGGVAWAAGTNVVGEIIDNGLVLPTVSATADLPHVDVAVAPDRLAEGVTGTATVTFTRSSTSGPLTVAFGLGGSASAADVTPLSGVVTFTAGQATATVTLAAVDDALVEAPETLEIRLLPSVIYAPGSKPLATVLILDNEPPVAPPALNDAARLLTQATFGPTLAEIARVQQIGLDAWFEGQVTAPRSSFVGYLRGVTDESVDEPHVQEAWVQHAATGPDQLRQRVANALLEIMVVANKNGLQGASWAHAAYMDVLMADAFGNYRTLLRDVTLNPAMGRFLDMLKNNRENPFTGQRPNENYAREVLQLFSVGEYRLNIDGTPALDANGLPIPTYGQEEVAGFAKVFTGWTYLPDQAALRVLGASQGLAEPDGGRPAAPLAERQDAAQRGRAARGPDRREGPRRCARQHLLASQRRAVHRAAADPAARHEQPDPRVRRARRTQSSTTTAPACGET